MLAQLRDAQTSELLAEGAPLVMALLAEQMGGGVLYDGVGAGFDSTAVKAVHRERVKQIELLAADPKSGVDEDVVLGVRAAEVTAESLVTEAKQAMVAARKRTGR